LAGFQVIINGRFWVITEACTSALTPVSRPYFVTMLR
jgi:hypothetical protein